MPATIASTSVHLMLPPYAKRNAKRNATGALVLPNKACEALLDRYHNQLEAVCWRRCDALEEVSKLRKVLALTGEKESKCLINACMAKLAKADVQKSFQVQVAMPDGTSHAIPVQTEFVASLDREGVPTLSSSTIGDIKMKVEEASGISVHSQILYCSDQDALEDAIFVQDCLSIVDKSTLYLVVDTDAHYWKMHSLLVKQYAHSMVKLYKLLQTSGLLGLKPTDRARMLRFMKNLKKAITFLVETRTKNRARSIDDIHRVERLLKDFFMPLLNQLLERRSLQATAATIR